MQTLNQAFFTTQRSIAILLLLVLVGPLAAFASEESNATVSVYQPSDDPMADVQRAIDAAQSADKLLLVVMGAQWCHDSRGLAEKFSDPEMAQLLDEYYETVFLDVGYYKDLRAISQRFDQPHYFATPTVMIINAENEQLLNASDMAMWGAADSVPAAEYLEYFTHYSKAPLPTSMPLPEAHAAAVSQFEQSNAQRLTEAYAQLVPGMQLEDRTGEARKDFLDQWREVRAYRMSLQKDIQSIREQLRESPEQSPVFPVYEAFSWDTQP